MRCVSSSGDRGFGSGASTRPRVQPLRPGFTTDPVVYARSQSLAEVAFEIDAATLNIDSSDGTDATVTFWNEQGLIVQRLDYDRGESRGWGVERGRVAS